MKKIAIVLAAALAVTACTNTPDTASNTATTVVVDNGSDTVVSNTVTTNEVD